MMKRKLFTIAIAALTVGLLGSCSKINDRLDNLESRIDGIERDKIASVEQQISAINQSISDLGSIRSDIQTLQNTSSSQLDEIKNLKAADEALGKDTDNLKKAADELAGKIEALGKADEAIGKRIDELKSYVDGELKDYAKTDWVKATFATLEQHEWTCDTIAKIDARIGALDEKLYTEIGKLEGSLKSWVNEQFSAYYTAAQMDAKLGDLQAQLDTIGGASGERVEELAAEIASAKASIDSAKTAVDTAKANIRNEYKAAIASAIQANEGKLTQAISDSLATVNSRISDLNGKVATLESSLQSLTSRVTALENMIQSVTIIPAYNDGSVEAIDGIITIDCIVEPASAVSGMTKDGVTVLVSTVKTKAAAYESISLKTFEADASKGTLSVTADISSITPADDQALMAALKITNGISKYTTAFVGVTIKSLPEDALKGAFSVSSGKQVYFSKGNLYCERSSKDETDWSWKFYDKQYDFTPAVPNNGHYGSDRWAVAEDTKIDLFTWGYNDNRSFDPISKESARNDSEYVEWGTTIDDAGTWRTLSAEEWEYLLNNDEAATVRKGKYKLGVTVCGIRNCLVIAPDNFSGSIAVSYDATAWDSAESDGLVCLPPAGVRYEHDVFFVGNNGYYQSSSANRAGISIITSFNNIEKGIWAMDESDRAGKKYGTAVRLVTEGGSSNLQ